MNTLDLATIAGTLESLEETIIHKLIDRAQFAVNARAYTAGESGFEGETTRSLFELRLSSQERMDAEFGRFLVPEERPFSTDLPTARRAVTLPDTGLAAVDPAVVSQCPAILDRYRELIPRICAAGDDGQYGSSVEHDVYALQAIARRIHYGALYVAESKYRDDPEGYRSLIEKRDSAGLMQKLTRREVEERIIERVHDKVIHLQEGINRQLRRAIDPNRVVAFYRDTIIPLTKEGEIAYLLNRPAQARYPGH
ncbi:MAG: hypothetical protein Kow006_20500 [Gammaproteobacteria bacterium]